jgi:twinkle protein
MISQETIDDLKQRMDIVDVVQEYIKLKRHGQNMVGLCPFHNEKTGSFTVSKARQKFKCFGCGNSGDAIDFLMHHEKKGYVEAVEMLCKKYNIDFDFQSGKKEFVKPVPRLEKLNKKHLDWFENDRLISNDTLLRLKITESREWMPQFQQDADVVCFNYFRNEELVNIKFRGPQKSFKLAKDAELIFYNIDAAKGEKEIVIVEGEPDTAALVESGVYNVIGVPNGTPPKGSKMSLEYLDNCYAELSHIESFIIAVDDDEVGRYLKEELSRRLGKEKCKVVTYPEGCKDPNNILQTFGKDDKEAGKQAVKDFIASAKQWPLEGIVSMDDMLGTIEDYYENGYPPGAESGVPGIDDLLTFAPGLNTMVTGIPGHGKDEVLNDVMVGLARNEGWVFAIFDFEDDPEIHVTKLMEKFTRKAFDYRKDPNDRMSRMEKDYAIGMVRKHFHFVNVNKMECTMENILSKLKELVERYGVNGVKINPWNYLEHKRNGMSETDYTSQELTRLISTCKPLGVHSFLFAHPTKMQKDKKTGLMEIPTLYHISGSAHFFAKTHNGICVYLNYSTMTTEVHIQKVKYYWHGSKGVATYSFNVKNRQFALQGVEKLGMKQQSTKQDFGVPDLPSGNWKPVPTDYKNYTEPDNKESVGDIAEDLPF